MTLRHARAALYLGSLALLPACAGGQEGGGTAAPSVASITEADVRRRIFIIAHDSMGGRDTPSPGLEKTAAYAAGEFRRLGLKPAGDAGGYIQRYAIDHATLGAKATTPLTRDLSGAEAPLADRDDAGGTPGAPNVVAILEGSDPTLRHEYVVFSAHMDHVGTIRGAKGDSIWNGADDDASGTVGVLELAEAFAHPAARTKRSLIFVLVSGEEKGLLGSAYFTANMPVPVHQVVADLNIDMIGRNWRDTIVAIGKEHSDLGATLDRVTREHPELRMKAIGDPWPAENFYSRSDHFNFARLGIPILFFFNGTHADYHQPSDSPDRIDAEKEARIVRLLFHLGTAVANAPERPKWNPESYRRIVR